MARSRYAQEAYQAALAIQEPNTQVGVGVDMVEVARMERIIGRTPSFTTKVFSPDEIAYCTAKPNPAMHFAARFAAKEAVVKALGTGFSCGIGMHDIEVVLDKAGRPTVVLTGRAAELAREADITDIEISLTHTDSEAMAFVVAISRLANEQAQQPDPVKELAQRFKEAKAMFDEMPRGAADADPTTAEEGSDAS